MLIHDDSIELIIVIEAETGLEMQFSSTHLRWSGKKSYVLWNVQFRFEHSLTPLTPSPTLRAGEGEHQSERRERTPLPFMGEGIKG